LKKLTSTQKKWLLSIHILFAAIWFGVTVAFLILSINVMLTDDINVNKGYYTSMLLLEQTSGKASIIGTVTTGILLSILTHWGLFKFYWIIVKEILTFISIGLGMAFIYFWTLNGITMLSPNGLQSQVFIVNHQQLLVGIGIQIISLGAVFIISLFKPWGKRKSSD
jgi:hypothetical protein